MRWFGSRRRKVEQTRPWSLYPCASGESEALFAVHDDADDGFSKQIRSGWKLRPHTKLAMLLLDGDDVFIDVGANIGTFSIPVTLHTGAGCLDVEALPSNVELLAASLAANKICNHRIEAVAALDSYDNVQIKGTSAFGTVNRSGIGIDVPAVPLDDILAETPFAKARLVKMDIEGSEQRALRGMSRFFGRPPDHVIFEANGAHCYANGYMPQDLMRFFEDRGYALYIVRPGRLVPRRASDFQEGALVDYLATRRRVDDVSGFAIGGLSLDDRIHNVLRAMTIEKAGYRAFMAAQLEHGPPEIQGHREVIQALQQLQHDPVEHVRNAVRSWYNEGRVS
jgi:FkbM family methyltransferase